MGSSSLPYIYSHYATVAQLVEHLPEEQGVGGSTPSGSTVGGAGSNPVTAKRLLVSRAT